MADPEHVGILKQGVAAWNAWRDDNPDIRPDLCGANLGDANLINANLRGADIIEANICHAALINTNLSRANLSGANLNSADLSKADLRGARLREANLSRASLREANLIEANLSGATLSRTNLDGANLREADFHEADLATAESLTQEQINTISFDPDSPPSLPIGLKLPEMGDNGEKTAPPNTPKKEDTPLRAHLSERIILSGQLATPTAQLRRKVSKQELEELRDLLAACILSSTPDRDNENVLRVAMKQESLDLLRTVVNTGIELHKAPSYPQGLIDALLGLGACLRFFKSSSDWAPLPKALQDKIGSTVNAYDAFLTELGLI